MTTVTGSHVAVLLTAGGSRRLGQAKALLPCGGVPLVKVMAQRLLAASPRQLLVITGADAERIVPHLSGLPVCIHHNPDWATGQSSSLRLAAKVLAADSGPVLLAGVDQPALQIPHLCTLLALFDGNHDVASGYAGTLGIPALLRAQTFRHAASLHGDQGLGARLRAPGASTRVVTEETLALDIDTDADLRDARAAGWIDPHC